MQKNITQLMLILLVMAAVWTSVCWAGQEQVGIAAADDDYLLGTGDLIEVQVWKEEGLSRTLRVRLDGRISLPLIGDIDAAGKSPRALAAQIEDLYRDSLAEPSVTVILSQSNKRYYVIGQVNQPGEFPLDGHLTVLQALARSGGFLEFAKTSKIAVIRRDGREEQLLTFDYDALKKGDLSQHLVLAPGDTIIVP